MTPKFQRPIALTPDLVPKTIAGMREKFPQLFAHQASAGDKPWFATEGFMHTPLPSSFVAKVPWSVGPGVTPAPDATHCCSRPLRLAVIWVANYILNPNYDGWDAWHWCLDRDSEGQKVYVGKRNGLWEIHRHLNITERWVTPVYR